MFEKLRQSIVPAVLLVAVTVGSGLPAEAKSPRGWGGARQAFLKGALLNPKQPKFIRGALQNQLNRWRQGGKTSFPRFKNPKGYDIGHHPMKRGSIDPKHLRFETSHDNRSRPQRAMARGRKKGLLAKYF
jgi:hypothetical protein